MEIEILGMKLYIYISQFSLPWPPHPPGKQAPLLCENDWLPLKTCHLNKLRNKL